MALLIAAYSPHFQLIVMVALHTGMRKWEILGLQWQDIDFAARLITVRLTKNNKPKVIPIDQSLDETLQSLPRHRHSPYVFCNSVIV
jgi:integrase